ncbi:SWI5-dependent HO expression protein 4 [Tieghemiomyces parasiticus]|uniref:SWI5-dependent HO expression protein 4 n=1 Tax=Tieghemiomyces parasiticus TaxID=78921 RepID=A0A9W8E388_9FUNG|nr:SWI5-dependent HO expression protein 4 [Tieghemiomyces parasiticus]
MAGPPMSNARSRSAKPSEFQYCHGQACDRLLKLCEDLHNLHRTEAQAGAESATDTIPGPPATTTCRCTEAARQFVSWTTTAFFPIDPGTAQPRFQATLLSQRPVLSVWTQALVELAALAAPSPFFYLVPALFPTALAPHASPCQRALLEQPALHAIFAQLAARFHAHLASPTVDADDTNGPEDPLAVELVTLLHRDVLDTEDRDLHLRALGALTAFLTVPYLNAVTVQTLTKDGGVFEAVFDTLEFRSVGVQYYTLVLAGRAATQKACAAGLAVHGRAYLKSRIQAAVRWCHDRDTAEADTAPVGRTLDGTVILGLLAVPAVAQLTITNRVALSTRDPSLPPAPELTEPVVPPLTLVLSLRTFLVRAAKWIPPTHVMGSPSTISKSRPTTSDPADHTLFRLIGSNWTLETLLESTLYCLYLPDLRAMILRDKVLWEALTTRLATPLRNLEQTDHLHRPLALALATSTLGLLHTIATFIDALTKYPAKPTEDQKQSQRLREYAQRGQNQDQTPAAAASAEPTPPTEAEMTDLLHRFTRLNPTVLPWWTGVYRHTMDFWKRHVEYRTLCLALPYRLETGNKADEGVAESENNPRLSLSLRQTLSTFQLAARSCTNLATAPPLRAPLVQGGAVSTLLETIKVAYTLLQLHPRNKAGVEPTTSSAASRFWAGPSADLRLTCVHALAKLTISVNPNLAFTSGQARSLAAVLSETLPLTADLEGDAERSDRRISPTLLRFEAIMALTNLASMQMVELPAAPGTNFATTTTAANLSVGEMDMGTYIAIPCGALTALQPLLLDDHPLIVRAAAELLCNLSIVDPVMTEYATSCQRFVDAMRAPHNGDAKAPMRPEEQAGEEDGQTRAGDDRDAPYQHCKIHLLIALTGSADRGTRSAASGALAILTGVPIIAQALAYHPRGPEALLDLLHSTISKSKAGSALETCNDDNPETSEEDDNDDDATSRTLAARAAQVEPDFPLMHRALACWRNVLEEFPRECPAYMEWVRGERLVTAIRDVTILAVRAQDTTVQEACTQAYEALQNRRKAN